MHREPHSLLRGQDICRKDEDWVRDGQAVEVRDGATGRLAAEGLI